MQSGNHPAPQLGDKSELEGGPADRRWLVEEADVKIEALLDLDPPLHK